MDIKVLDNIDNKLIDVLETGLLRTTDLRFAIAFLKYSGFRMIESSIKTLLEKNTKIEFLTGLDFKNTEPKVLRIIHNLRNSGYPIRCYCFRDSDLNNKPVYHPKLYLLGSRSNSTIVTGSSNLTEGGLKKNVEVNVIITALNSEEIISDFYNVYDRLKFQNNRFEPNISYIDIYEEAYLRLKRQNAKFLRKNKKLLNNLKEIEKTLPKPFFQTDKLFGWTKLVYKKLPDGTFKTSDLYIHEKEFSKVYPQNKNIKAKIRQQLQLLRDMGVISHPERKNWKKI